MQEYYVPILVDINGKKELWRFDLDGYSIEQLCQIKKALLEYSPYTKSITSIDKLIREKTEDILPYSKIYGKSYIRVYKENKKQQKLKKCKKIRRR